MGIPLTTRLRDECYMIFVGEESDACAVRFDKNEATKMNEFEEFDKFRKSTDSRRIQVNWGFKACLR